MVGFAAEPIELVRVGVIGLGMRGPGAVNRLSHIDGCQVVALCDIREDCVKKSQQILERNGKPAAAEYFGDENVWKQLCERDDIDLVYVCTDWKKHAEMGVYAMEHGKHVAIEPFTYRLQGDCGQFTSPLCARAHLLGSGDHPNPPVQGWREGFTRGQLQSTRHCPRDTVGEPLHTC